MKTRLPAQSSDPVIWAIGRLEHNRVIWLCVCVCERKKWGWWTQTGGPIVAVHPPATPLGGVLKRKKITTLFAITLLGPFRSHLKRAPVDLD